MTNIVYVPIIKTGDAEIRGVENLSSDAKDNITPLFVLTRSRKSKNKKHGDIFRRLDRLEEAYGNRPFILDLTGDPILSNQQIEELHSSNNGYENWFVFLVSLTEDFPGLIPTIQISDEGVDSAEEFYDRLRNQAKSLGNLFGSIAYRFPLEYEDFNADLSAVCEVISSDKIICVVDAGFIAQKKSNIYSEKAISVISELNNFSLGKIILSATSFPKNPTDFGGEEYGQLNLEECIFFNTANRATHLELIYGDYATINPIRSLQAGGRGWIPRIDLPMEELIFYHRSRKSKLGESYATAYTRVAKLVTNDQRYNDLKSKIGDCWGTEQIESAAAGHPKGLSPSYWISVRMNIHMTLRRKIL